MSRVRERFLHSKVTVWRASGYTEANPYGDGWAFLGVYDCSYITNGSLTRDDEGNEFRPLATIYTQTDSMQFGDRVVIGDFTGTPLPVVGAQTVRTRKTKQPLVGVQDYTFQTG